jgi:hypothetical protein
MASLRTILFQIAFVRQLYLIKNYSEMNILNKTQVLNYHNGLCECALNTLYLRCCVEHTFHRGLSYYLWGTDSGQFGTAIDPRIPLYLFDHFVAGSGDSLPRINRQSYARVLERLVFLLLSPAKCNLRLLVSHRARKDSSTFNPCSLSSPNMRAVYLWPRFNAKRNRLLISTNK